MVTLKKELRNLISCFFISILFFSCQKSLNNDSLPIDPEEFVNYSIDGINYAYAAPADTIGMHNPFPVESTTFGTSLRIHSTGQLDGNFSTLSFSYYGIAVNSDQPLQIFGTTNLFGAYNPLLPQNTVSVHITEYGQTGEFIAGNFHGVLFETQAPNQNQPHTVACSFRVRRTY
ncbi:MAG: hypothetical protein ABI741_09640 [Ferruginibacter sp.]